MVDCGVLRRFPVGVGGCAAVVDVNLGFHFRARPHFMDFIALLDLGPLDV